MNGIIQQMISKYNSNTLEVREELLTLSGVGPKVADCILLFGFVWSSIINMCRIWLNYWTI